MTLNGGLAFFAFNDKKKRMMKSNCFMIVCVGLILIKNIKKNPFVLRMDFTKFYIVTTDLITFYFYRF
ncbi:hypothetical protein DCO46_15455 [Flavobacterium sp. HTF]|nr:hypothetical protein DCO46_15455 [Flavobacterium sp. HTF]